MENKKRALGIGLEQLFTNERIDFEKMEEDIIASATPNDIQEISLVEVRSNPYQPRKYFDEKALLELSASIKEHGVVEPIIVKKSIKGYEIVAGERRVKASKLAGLKTIPAIVREFNDNQMMEIALIENIQREDLNPIEEAKAFEFIIQKTGLTQEEVAKKFGKSRSYLTNLLGLLRLPSEVQNMVICKDISMAHARSLSKLENPTQVIELANKIKDTNINVHDLEKMLTQDMFPKKVQIKKKQVGGNYHMFEEAMREKIGTKVKIHNRKIEIPFDSEKDLERIMEIINISLESE